MVNLILCGGSGTRLWPISRKGFPKQFCKIINNRSFFQETILRNTRFSEQVIITNSDHYFIAADQAEELGRNELSFRYILEPVGRNTAPAIAIACFMLDPEEVVLVSPSDHLISDIPAYGEVIDRALKAAAEGNLITFGIEPEYAETGYGYLECRPDGDAFVMDVIKFHEKPAKETAEKYVASGNFFWNSGMFCFKAGTFLNELKKYAPDIYEKAMTAYKNAAEKEKSDNMLSIELKDMEDIPSRSVDYAVMENSGVVKAVMSDFGWSDIGSFDALSEIFDKDGDNNSCNPDYMPIDSYNNFILAEGKKIVTVDVRDMVVIDTDDALLICKKGSTQNVKKAVEKLAADNDRNGILDLHPKVNRPWGTYCVIESADYYKVKKIVVNPGRKLSLQLHKYRSEHWVVLSGKARVTKGDEELIVNQNESIYIPVNEKHRLECISAEPLVIIEVQVGSYLGEDDIERFSDDYNRI